ncbi:hypothetical protein Nepgr_018443 [Nepenthes gracilis]|uniref:FLZ-type domain-containing protein n=1 Tax=Nepenthes gracilis TaxID=150966 RepID=A0AAD3XT30_NEPGR|nr:hypothetical protein Nepgr_018443 [Nepenthes gracilis]
MLGKRSRQAIGKLTGALCAGIVQTATSPMSQSNYKTQSQRGLKNYDHGGVGLGLVVALDKSGTGAWGGEIRAKSASGGQFLSRSDPIPVTSPRNFDKFSCFHEESLENYTYVTNRIPDKSVTKVYYDGGEYGRLRFDAKKNNVGGGAGGAFKISPAISSAADFNDRYPSDFLSSCHLCRKALHGKDIYMYRGEKAFCSAECRQRQIVMDERKEKCRSKASRSVEVSSSPYTGIVAV